MRVVPLFSCALA
ncbi:Protein of unknown function [Propionibacterium freudenreichii]|nr:Protein of unknown function [Propionibacterium freudenreichii subsp. freudenreichii]CEG87434.1 Protein of unknown function [Propionibacterium freudenreichii]CEG92109.1 Protein of unknown function [Propionibacterium freudenreichii]CEG94766.1 Protein of unknown function [Propionibacterium freudenreichii]CEG98816.1 Protein of unknown function [Propionibacterium freudenreichii]